MEYKFTKLPKSEIEIEVTVPFAEFEPHVKRAAILISEETDIEGFRRGKAPYEIIKKTVGEARMYERAADLAVRKNWQDVIKKLTASDDLSDKHPIIGRPEITVTKLAPGNELIFKVKATLLPEITLPDYKEIAKKIRQERKEVLVEDEEIEKALVWLQESRMELNKVPRHASVHYCR
jgi:trigger factor